MEVRTKLVSGLTCGLLLSSCAGNQTLAVDTAADRVSPNLSHYMEVSAPGSESNVATSELVLQDDLVSTCQAVISAQGKLNEETKNSLSVENARKYRVEKTSRPTLLIRTTQGNQPQTSLALLNGKPKWLNTSLKKQVENVELLLCLQENRRERFVRKCNYQYDWGLGSLLVFNTKAKAYLVEAQTLNLVATTDFTAGSKSCPSTYEFAPGRYAEALQGLAIPEQQVTSWLSGLEGEEQENQVDL